jgi:hypothetical protein
MFTRPFAPPAPEISHSYAWAICPWLSRTAGEVILKPTALAIIQARMTRSISEFSRALIDGILPATQAAAAAFNRFGVAFAGVGPVLRQVAESTAGWQHVEPDPIAVEEHRVQRVWSRVQRQKGRR